MTEWLVAAGTRVLAELGTTATKSESAVSFTCFSEARRTVAVCFGLGEELLEHRRVVYTLVFVAGFAVGAIVSPLASGLVQLRQVLLSGVGRCARRRRIEPVERRFEPEEFYAAQGGWRPLELSPSPVTGSNGALSTTRRSRFAVDR
jgi:hypothetical protein